MAIIEESAIRERAYSLWEKDAHSEGAAKFYWHLARQQLEARAHPQAVRVSSEFDRVKFAAYLASMSLALDRVEGATFAKCKAD